MIAPFDCPSSDVRCLLSLVQSLIESSTLICVRQSTSKSGQRTADVGHRVDIGRRTGAIKNA